MVRDLRRDRPVGRCRPADALGHLGRVARRLRPLAHRHAVQSVDDPVRLQRRYTLSFWLHIDSAEIDEHRPYDTLTVKLGSTTLATYSNPNKASGYVQRTFNVAGFAGQTVTLTFTGTENSRGRRRSSWTTWR